MSNSRDIADSAATINFIDGVTSNVQTQLNTATTAIAANTTAIGNINPSASLEAVASGTLANGDTVVINADGTVTAAGLASTPVPVIGSSVEWESGGSQYIVSCYDTSANKVVIAYADAGDNNKGKVVVGTVASGAITFGSPAIFDSSTVYWVDIAYDSNANKVVIVYRDEGNGSAGSAIVGTVSGTSISFGSVSVYESGSGDRNKVVFDSSANKVIIAWHYSSTYKVTVGTISGTSISFGAVASTSAPSANPAGLVYDTNANKSLLCYRGPSNYGYAAVISVSGTTASIGTPAAFVSETVSDVDAVYDSSNNKTLIVWRKAGNNYGAGIVATISGTSVTFGTEAVIASETGFYFAASFDTTVNKSIVAYYNSSSGYSKSVQGTISGTSVTFSSATTYLTAQTQYNALVYDPDSERTVFAFGDGGNSYKGTSLLYSATTQATNLTSENYIGISDAAYANGATAKIQLASATDDAQSGLTAGQSYFVQENGSLSLTPDTTPVFAGTAVSATKLLIGERNELPYQTGNSGKFLTTNGSAASWGEAGGGALELISTTTISGSPNTIDITSGFSSTYDNYIVIASGVSSSANNDNVYMQVYKNSTLVTSSYTYNTQAGSQLFNYSGFNNIAYVAGADSGWQVNITNANSGLFSMNSTGLYRGINVGYNTTGTGIVTGIRFSFQSGSTTFTQGQIRLYGFKKS